MAVLIITHDLGVIAELVDEVIVIGIPDPYRQEAPKVFVKLKPGASLTFEELKKHLDGKIGKHEMPREIEFRKELPKTAVGKLSKKELVAEEKARRASARQRLEQGVLDHGQYISNH